MQIHAEGLCKRFTTNYIIKDFNYHFLENTCYGISGMNGAGKTTLMNLLAGLLSPSKGKIVYVEGTKEKMVEDVIHKMTFAAPYANLLDYYSLQEYLHFYSGFKKLNIQINELLETIKLDNRKHDLISSFSSGMKQRIKLALALYSDVEVVFLDEPISFLDIDTQKWYYELLNEQGNHKMIIISSNEESDFAMVDHRIKIGET